jgi:putative ABC transport system substrate-binding protein
MRRRAFLAGAGAAAVWPLAVRAQQPAKTVGFLGAYSVAWGSWTAAFAERLHQLGWIEGQTIAIAYRWEEGRPERDAEFAADFVRAKVDVIVTTGTAAVTVMKATSAIPIVVTVANDPGGSLIAIRARPDANVTGMSFQGGDLASKRLELLREIIPGLRRLAIMFHVGNAQAVLEMGAVEAAARALKLEAALMEIRSVKDIASTVAGYKGRTQALYVVGDALVSANRPDIIASALRAGLPTVVGVREFVEAGALISYGPSFPELFRRAADLVDKILRGTRPGDIPLEQPTKFELVVNLKTAKALGVEIAPALLARANEVIQ